MSKQETKTCQNCESDFVIEPEDFDFYKKIDVPAPTFCPECRNQRRLSWRNERTLYKRKCNAPGHKEDIISMYAPDSPYAVYDAKYWWSDEWDPMEYGIEYDFSRSFFEQYAELLRSVPMITLSNLNSQNSDYTNFVDGNKNCYLIFGGGWNENVSYSNKMMENKDSQDLLMTSGCELSYECVNCVDSYRLFWSNNSKNCTNSYFLYSCRNCSDCFGCSNLVNKSYCIFNKQYSKEDYFKELEKFKLSDRNSIKELRKRFKKDVYLKSIHRYANIFTSVDCTGDNINNSKNCKNCFDIYHDVEDSKHLYSALETKDDYDGNGIYKNERLYDSVDCNVGSKNSFGLTLYNCTNTDYSFNCHSSSNLFGCVGLRSKEYCILNKAYSKEEYESLKKRIIDHMNENPYVDKMDRKCKYGEFFPSELSPWAYNETIAQEYYNLSKEKAEQAELRWRSEEKKKHEPTLMVADIPDDISNVEDDILKEILECAHRGECTDQCTSAFKITSADLDFHRNLEIPLPELCPNCRHYARLAERNPMRLYHRQCQCAGEKSDNGTYQNTSGNHPDHAPGEHCPNEFQTSYSPDRPEIIYCENCYQNEVT